MNNQDDIILALERKEKDLIEQANTIRKAINVLLGKNEDSTPLKQKISSPIGISEAIKNAFDDYPDRNWTPPLLRDELQKLKEKKLLNSTANDLLTSINSPLQRLVKNGIVEKTGQGINTKYKKREKS